MIPRYIVAICAMKLCIAQQTIIHRTENMARLGDVNVQESYERGFPDVERILSGTTSSSKSNVQLELQPSKQENDRIGSSSDEHKINKEPITLLGLTPRPLLDAVAGIRSDLEGELFKAIENSLKDTVAKQLIDGALDKVEVIKSIMRKCVNVIKALTDEDVKKVGDNIDKMFRERIPALRKHLDGKCFQSRSTTMFDTKFTSIKDYTPPSSAELNDMQAALNSIENKMSEEGNEKSSKSQDRGAICINVKSLVGGEYQMKAGTSVGAQTSISLVAGITVPDGDVRLTGSAGFQVSLGQKDIKELSNRRLLRQGVNTNRNTLENLKKKASSTYWNEAGVTIYFPGATAAMDGWGGLDIGFTMKALRNFDGITFHVRHPWYSCPNLLDEKQWFVTGLTIKYFNFTNSRELSNGIETFPGFSQIVSNLKNAVDPTTWEDEKGFSLTVGANLAIGLDSTNKTWDFQNNFHEQPFSGGTNSCDRRRAEEIVTEDTIAIEENNALHKMHRESRHLEKNRVDIDSNNHNIVEKESNLYRDLSGRNFNEDNADRSTLFYRNREGSSTSLIKDSCGCSYYRLTEKRWRERFYCRYWVCGWFLSGEIQTRSRDLKDSNYYKCATRVEVNSYFSNKNDSLRCAYKIKTVKKIRLTRVCYWGITYWSPSQVISSSTEEFKDANYHNCVASTQTNNDIKDVMGVLIEFLGKGGIKIPYCFGDCKESEPNKKIEGNVTIVPPDTCDGVVLKADAKQITVANVGYLIINEVNSELAGLISSNLGALGEFGISTPSIALELGIYPKITVTATGFPRLPELSNNKNDGFKAKIVNGLVTGLEKIQDLNFEVHATLQSLEYVEIGFKLSLKPQRINKYIQFQDIYRKKGISVFTEYKINGLPIPKTQILTFGLNIPMSICTAKCNSNSPLEQQVIYLNGKLSTELTVATDEPAPVATIGGTFSMIGMWNNALGIPTLHISNVVAGAHFDITKFPKPTPTKIILGGAICIGSQNACKNEEEKKFIKGRMYLKWNDNAPEENGIIGLLTTTTFEHILNVAGEYDSKIKDFTNGLIGLLPDSLLTSGLYPSIHSDSCKQYNNDTALALGKTRLNLDCFVYLAVAPEQSVEIEEVNMIIPKGISFGGKLKFLDIYELRANGSIDIFTPGSWKFNVDAEIDISFGNNVRIGEKYENGAIHDSAKFEIRSQIAPLILSIDIKGAIHIPFMDTWGSISFEVNVDHVEFEGVLHVFGGIFNPTAKVYWKWDMSIFRMELGNIYFIGGILKVDHLQIMIDLSDGGKLSKALFSCEISVCNFLKIAGRFEVEKNNSGGGFKMYFKVSADIGVAAGTVWGSAILDINDISKTSITDINYRLSVPQWMKDVGKAIVGALNTVCEGVLDAISWAGDKLEEAAKLIADVGTAIVDYINKFGSSVKKAAQHLLDGNFDAAFDELEQTAKKVWDDAEKALADAGKTFVSALDDAAKAFDAAMHEILSSIGFMTIKDEISHKVVVNETKPIADENFCYYKRVTYKLYKTYKTCYNLVFARWCEDGSSKTVTKTVNEFNDAYAKCLCEREAQEDMLKDTLDNSSSTEKKIKTTKLANEKLLDADIIEAAKESITEAAKSADFPDDGNFNGHVTSGDHAFKALVKGSAIKLSDSSQRGTFSVKRDFDVSSNDNVENSLVGLQNTVGDEISKIQTTNLGTVSDTIKPVLRSNWYDYVNKYDKPLVVHSKNSAICGIGSQYDNDSKSRRYRFKYCAPNIVAGKKGKIILDQYSTECGGNKFITGILTNSDSFYLTCEEFENTEKGRQCEWSAGGGWYNRFEADFDFECGENSIMAGLKRKTSMNYNDQLFSFQCCHVLKKSNIITSDWTDYLNAYKAVVNANAVVNEHGAAICGISSHHNNNENDRKFKLKYCRPAATSASRGTLNQLGVTRLGDGTWTMECPGNKFMSKVESTFDNYHKDRRFTFHCGEFTGYVRNNDCQWSNGDHWVNEMNNDFTYACPPKMSIVTIVSQRSDDKDRRFKFRCCRMQKTMTRAQTSTTNYCSKGSDGGWESNHHTAFLQSHQVNFDLNSPSEMSQTAIFNDIKAFLNTRPRPDTIPAYTKSIITIALSPDQKTEVCQLDARVCTDCGNVYNWEEVEVPNYRFKSIIVSKDGNHIYGICQDFYLWYLNGFGGNWQMENIIKDWDFGRIEQVAVNRDGSVVLALKSDGVVWRKTRRSWKRYGEDGIGCIAVADSIVGGHTFVSESSGKYCSIAVNDDGTQRWYVVSDDQGNYRNYRELHECPIKVFPMSHYPYIVETCSWQYLSTTSFDNDPKMKQMSVIGDGTDVWGVTTENKAYERTGVEGDWHWVRDNIQWISVTGDANHVWAVDTDRRVHYGTTCF